MRGEQEETADVINRTPRLNKTNALDGILSPSLLGKDESSILDCSERISNEGLDKEDLYKPHTVNSSDHDSLILLRNKPASPHSANERQTGSCRALLPRSSERQCPQQTSVVPLPNLSAFRSTSEEPAGDTDIGNSRGGQRTPMSIWRLLHKDTEFKPNWKASIWDTGPSTASSTVKGGDTSSSTVKGGDTSSSTVKGGDTSSPMFIWRLLNKDTCSWTNEKIHIWGPVTSDSMEVNSPRQTSNQLSADSGIVRSLSDVPEHSEDESCPSDQGYEALQEGSLRTDLCNNTENNRAVSHKPRTDFHDFEETSSCSPKEASQPSDKLEQNCSALETLSSKDSLSNLNTINSSTEARVLVADISRVQNFNNTFPRTVPAPKSTTSNVLNKEVLLTQEAPSYCNGPISSRSHQDTLPETPESYATNGTSIERIVLPTMSISSLPGSECPDTLKRKRQSNLKAEELSNNVNEANQADDNSPMTIFSNGVIPTLKKRRLENELSLSLDRLFSSVAESADYADKCNHFSKPRMKQVTLVEALIPSLEELRSSTIDLLRGFCGTGCLGLTSHSKLAWYEINDELHPQCPECLRKGARKTVIIHFWFKLRLKDVQGKLWDTIFSGENASGILGCTRDKFIADLNVRKRVLKSLKLLIDRQDSFYVTIIKVQNCKGTHYRAIYPESQP